MSEGEDASPTESENVQDRLVEGSKLAIEETLDPSPRFKISAQQSLPYIMLVVAGVGSACSGPGQTFGVTMFIPFLLRSANVSRNVGSLLFTIATICGGTSTFPWGYVIDRFHLRVAFMIAAIGLGLGLLILSCANTWWILLIGFAGMRIFGQSGMLLCAQTLVPQWWLTKRGIATSFASMGGVFSQGIYPAFCSFLMYGPLQLPWYRTIQVVGCIELFLFFPAVSLIVRHNYEDWQAGDPITRFIRRSLFGLSTSDSRDAYERVELDVISVDGEADDHEKEKDNEKDNDIELDVDAKQKEKENTIVVGIESESSSQDAMADQIDDAKDNVPDEANPATLEEVHLPLFDAVDGVEETEVEVEVEEGESKIETTGEGVVEAEERDETEDQAEITVEAEEEISWTWQEALRTRSFWCVASGQVVIALILTGLFFHLVEILVDAGGEETYATVVLLCSAVSTGVNNIPMGLLTDKVGGRIVLALGLCSLSAVLLVLGCYPWLMEVLQLALLPLVGFLLGMTTTCISVSIAPIMSNDFGRKSLGRITGISRMIMVFGSSSGPIMMSLPRGYLGGFSGILLVSTILPVIVAVANLVVRKPTRKEES